MANRLLIPIALLAGLLHAVGIARSSVPAQDGLKFLRVAREFHSRPWAEVIRRSDQHPLYPASIALMQPVVGKFFETPAESWRIAAQVVSALASIATIAPLYSLSRRLFDAATATMAALLFVLLPTLAEVGHDTLADPLALLATASSLAFGLHVVESRRFRDAIGCGVAAGLGYLARPEVAIVPMAMAITAIVSWSPRFRLGSLRPMAAMSLGLLVIVGSYAVVKGEVSEKLTVRKALQIPSPHDQSSREARKLPPGLDDTRWDFAAKEEADHPSQSSLGSAASRLFANWAEVLGYVLVIPAIWGAWRIGSSHGRAIAIYSVFFAAILLRHAMNSGYLSTRHAFSLALISLPFAAATIVAGIRRVRAWREAKDPGCVGRTTWPRIASLAILLTLAISAQFHRPPHPSRWGHNQAGRWLAEHAKGR